LLRVGLPAAATDKVLLIENGKTLKSSAVSMNKLKAFKQLLFTGLFSDLTFIAADFTGQEIGEPYFPKIQGGV